MSALKAKRRGLAEAAKVPAYIIFNDRTLIEMAETRPRDLDGMARVGGVGAKKLETYGKAFLEVINGEVQQMHPTRRKLAGRDAGTVYDQLLQVQADLARGFRRRGQTYVLLCLGARQGGATAQCRRQRIEKAAWRPTCRTIWTGFSGRSTGRGLDQAHL